MMKKKTSNDNTKRYSEIKTSNFFTRLSIFEAPTPRLGQSSIIDATQAIGKDNKSGNEKNYSSKSDMFVNVYVIL